MTHFCTSEGITSLHTVVSTDVPVTVMQSTIWWTKWLEYEKCIFFEKKRILHHIQKTNRQCQQWGETMKGVFKQVEVWFQLAGTIANLQMGDA